MTLIMKIESQGTASYEQALKPTINNHCKGPRTSTMIGVLITCFCLFGAKTISFWIKSQSPITWVTPCCLVLRVLYCSGSPGIKLPATQETMTLPPAVHRGFSALKGPVPKARVSHPLPSLLCYF